MKVHNPIPFRFVLPLPGFVLRPRTAVVIAAAHVYLAAGHLSRLIAGEIRSRCEVRVDVEVLRPGTLPKTEFKARRIRDTRRAG